jgi:hypothetical protein
MYLAFDPGGKHTGWARFSKEGQFIAMGVCNGREELYAFLDIWETWLSGPRTEPLSIIIEDFEMYPHMQDKLIWSTFEVCRTIGIIEGWAHAHSVTRVHFQKPAIKSIAYMWAGMENKHKHDEDAYVHGIHWLLHLD